MICRGGIVVDGCGDVRREVRTRGENGSLTAPPLELTRDHRTRWSIVVASVVVVATALALLPHRTEVPPVVESDYCYLLLAADRLHDGHGLTSLPPVAPLQPWTWQGDWTFLTKWPIGYPLLVCGVRTVLGGSTLDASQWISLVVCAASVVGWFLWSRLMVPRCVTGILLALVVAGCSVSTAMLLDPSTDLLLVAALPYVLMLAVRAVAHARSDGHDLADGNDPGNARRSWLFLVCTGVAAGGLFWLRYASVFVPTAIGTYLLIAWWRSSVRMRHAVCFAASAAIPIGVLIGINQAFGTGESPQAQMNLGQSIGFNPSLAKMAEAWWRFTDLGFYDHHAWTHWVYATWPMALVVVGACIAPIRRMLVTFTAAPAACLSLLTVACLLVLLLASTALFGNKFDYVALDRYYAPIRPLYYLLFAAPVLWIPRRAVRISACVACLAACSWIVQQEWIRSYERRVADAPPRTSYGQSVTCFAPHANELYRWLAKQPADDLVVVSNFHEWIALETGVPAIPIPPNVETLNSWIETIRVTRGGTNPRVLFVLNPDNGHRDYWIAPPKNVIATFDLHGDVTFPPTLERFLFTYTG